MNKKLILRALLITAAALAAVTATRKLAMAAEVGDPCTTEHGRSGYMVASGLHGDDLICVADGGSAE